MNEITINIRWSVNECTEEGGIYLYKLYFKSGEHINLYNSTFKVVIVNSDQVTSTTSSPRGIYEAAVRRAEITQLNKVITAEPRLRYKQRVKVMGREAVV